MHLHDARHCRALYSHNPLLPTKMVDHRAEWADTLKPLGHKQNKNQQKPSTCVFSFLLCDSECVRIRCVCAVFTLCETFAACCPHPVLHLCFLHLQTLQVHLKLTAVLLMLQHQGALAVRYNTNYKCTQHTHTHTYMQHTHVPSELPLGLCVDFSQERKH